MKQHKKDSCIVYAVNWLIPWLIGGHQTLHRPDVGSRRLQRVCVCPFPRYQIGIVN